MAKRGGQKLISGILISILFASLLFSGVIAQEATTETPTETTTETTTAETGTETGTQTETQTQTEIEFSEDIAGWTPDNAFLYFFDFFGTPQERLEEAGLMAQEGNVEAMQRALDRFASEVEDQRSNVEGISVEGVTIESLQSGENLQELYGTQADLLNYQVYIDAIDSVLGENVEDNSVVEETISAAEDSIASVGAVVEERAVEAIDEAAENSGVPSIESDFAFEEGLVAVAGERYPETSPRFQGIADITDVQELRATIDSLREEIAALEESGDSETADAARDLLNMAESHGVYCLHASESELGITGDIHLNAAENFLADAEGLLAGEVEVSELEDELEHALITQEEIQVEIQEERDDAVLFAEDYPSLQERYADDPARLVVLESESERLQAVEQLGTQLYDNRVIERWTQELTDEGLSEQEVAQEISERYSNEWNNVYGGEYIPPGMFENPGEEIRVSETGEDGQGTEAIGIGRVDVVERIDPITGEVRREMVGWYNGAPVESVQEGGGFAYGVPYVDPSSGYTYTFAGPGYTYVTQAGVIYGEGYSEEYTPSDVYDYGDEVVSYRTSEGDEVVYSPTGYEVRDEAGEIIVEQAYTQESVVFAGGSVLDNEPTGYVFNDNGGESFVYAYNPETESYTDVANGKVYVPTTGAHVETTSYDSATGTYRYNYGGADWNYHGDGLWKSPGEKDVRVSVVPAPVGYYGGAYTTPSGKTWTFDPAANKWTESSTGSSYVVAPNNQYRYDERTGYMTDPKGTSLAPVGTVAYVNGEIYTVTADKGWTNPNGEPVAPPYNSETRTQYPSSMSGYSGGYASGASGGGTGYSNNNVWNYDSGSRQWVTPDYQQRYDPASGNLIGADGTVIAPEATSGQGSGGSCYGCYYQGGEGTSGQAGQVRAYTYDYGGYYERTIDGGYGYVSGAGQYQGQTSTIDAQGNPWTRGTDGTWTSSTGQTYTPGSNGYGGFAPGGYTADGSYTPPSGGYPAGSAAPTGAGYGYSYGCANGACGGGYGYYSSGEGYNAQGQYVGGYYAANPGQSAADYYAAFPNAVPGSYAPEGGTYGGYTGGSYTGGSYGSYTGGYYGGDTGGSYSGGYYGGEGSSGTYSSGGSYTGGSYTGGSYTGGDSGSYTGGSYTGGDTGGSYTSGGDSGGSTTTGGDSGGTTTGGDSGGATTGGDSGGAVGGGVVTEFDKVPSGGQKVINFFKKIFFWKK